LRDSVYTENTIAIRRSITDCFITDRAYINLLLIVQLQSQYEVTGEPPILNIFPSFSQTRKPSY